MTTGIVLVVFGLLAARLLVMIDAHAVNVLFWDQWDLFDAFFADAGFWEMFRWGHGPHRQGVAFPITRWVMDATAWNARADAFHVAAWVIGATALAIALRRRLFGNLALTDVAIPVLLLTPAQYGIFIHTPNASHGAAPLALLVAQAFAWTLPRLEVRLAVVLVLNFLLLHTGFGLFAGAGTLLLLAAETIAARRRGEPRAVAFGSVALVLALASVAVFFVGYRPDTAVDDFQFPSPHWPQYPRYVALMLANVLGLKGIGPLPTFAGFLALILAAWVTGERILRLLRGADEDRTSRVVVALVLFSLLFCAATAVGRISLGMNAAQSTRYVPLVVPLFLGLFLHVQDLAPRPRMLVSATLVVVFVAATFPMRAPEAAFMRVLHQAKQSWAETYRRTGSIDEADRAAGRRIYHSDPESTRLQQKLDWMEERRLGLFRDPD